MYEKEDYVICGSGGVWKIKDIMTDASTHKRTEYLLSAYENGGIEMIVPIDGEEIVRKITDEAAMTEAIQRIPYIRIIQAPNDKVRAELYEEAMSKYDEVEWLKVIKSVYLRGRQKGIKPFEVSCARKAKKYLHSEVSILLGIPFADVENFISELVAKNA
jgi:CarD family transcriptional regulator